LEELAFLALAAVAVATGLAALLVRELVHTILWVSVFFVDLSGIYFLLDAPFLGVLQLGVYAGAVTVLLLFGIMVTRKRIFSRDAATGLGPMPLALAAVVFIVLVSAIGQLPSGAVAVTDYDPSALSAALFGTYGPYLLLLGLVLLGRGRRGDPTSVREGPRM
ncbi:membrane protein, partial [mine drainage metagenome]